MHTRIYLLLVIICIAGQTDGQMIDDSPLLEIAYNKTSSIIFPAVITSVDRGSRDILAQKAQGVANVLQLKAARENFPETNLTVITTDGILYQFTINYSRQPTTLTVDLRPVVGEGQQTSRPLILQSDLSESEMERNALSIINARKPLITRKETCDKIKLSLNGIYIRDNVIFYHLRIQNQSSIAYDVEFLRFFIQDQITIKRTASQEVDVKPVYVYGDAKQIAGNSTQDIVYALTKFTIPDTKHLIIELFEKNGGRNIQLSIKNRSIVNARLIE